MGLFYISSTSRISIPILLRNYGRCIRGFSVVPEKAQNGALATELLDRVRESSKRNEVAIIDDDGARITTYGELDMYSSMVAEYLRDKFSNRIRGLSTIAGLNQSNRNYVIALLAAWKLRKCFLPLSPSHTISELQYFISDAEAKLVLTSTQTRHVLDIESVIDIDAVIDSGSSSCNQSTAGAVGINEVDSVDISSSVDALILYTSGTTGKPKGVVHTMSGLNHMIKDLVESWQYSKHDKILHFLPLHHLHGVLNKLLCMLWVGGTVDFALSSNADYLWKRLAENRGSADSRGQSGKGRFTIFMAVPTVYSKMLEKAERMKTDSPTDGGPVLLHGTATLRGMRLHVSGSAALPDTVLYKWRSLTGHTLLERYGMTEIGMALSNPYIEENNKKRTPGSVGQPLPSMKCKLVDDEGSDVTDQIDVPGELRVKGPGVFRAYLNREKETRASFDGDGFFKTGDVAARTGNGDYRLLGRLSADIIKSAGYKLSALEIEREILAHPQVEEATVLGVPCDVLGEKVVALIRPRTSRQHSFCVPHQQDEERISTPTSSSPSASSASMSAASLTADNAVDEMAKFLSDRLARYKHPRVVKIIFDDIPRNQLGKVNKKEVAKAFFTEK